MEIGKDYYVVMNNEGRLFVEVLHAYGSNVIVEKIIETTKDIREAKVFSEYDEAKELADRYEMSIKMIRTDVIVYG